ncbi:MAG: LysM domain-containing protein [Phycisphaerales bacterium]
MTREQKLALVLGFAAVLVVGLLISDHMAAARSDGLEAAPHDATVLIDATEGQALKRVVTLPETARQDPAAGGDAAERYRGRPVTRQAERPAGEDVAPSDAASARSTLADAGPEREPDPEPIRLVLGPDGGITEPTRPESVLERVGDTVAGGADALAKRIRDLTGLASATPINGMAQLDQTPGAAVARPASTAPVVVQHHVQPNESLYKIAEEYYGDGNAWRRIVSDNPGRVGENGSVREGVTLRILDPKRGVGTPASQADVAAAEPSRERRSAPTGGALTYTVQSGDTLGEISQKLLGTVRRQHELIALNKDVLKDPDRLRAGMVLRLPSS